MTVNTARLRTLLTAASAALTNGDIPLEQAGPALDPLAAAMEALALVEAETELAQPTNANEYGKSMAKRARAAEAYAIAQADKATEFEGKHERLSQAHARLVDGISSLMVTIQNKFQFDVQGVCPIAALRRAKLYLRTTGADGERVEREVDAVIAMLEAFKAIATGPLPSTAEPEKTPILTVRPQ